MEGHSSELLTKKGTEENMKGYSSEELLTKKGAKEKIEGHSSEELLIKKGAEENIEGHSSKELLDARTLQITKSFKRRSYCSKRVILKNNCSYFRSF